MKILKKSPKKGMILDCGFVVYVINQLILRVNRNILNPNLMNTKKYLVSLVKEYEFDKPENTKIVFIIDKCARECYNK